MTDAKGGPAFIRGRKRSFTIIQDDDFVEGMSARAWGVYSYLVGKPAGWECRIYDLVGTFKEGRDALYAVIKELADLGLLARETYYEGNLQRVRYRLNDDEPTPGTRRSAPETESQEPEAPDSGNAAPDNPPQVKKEEVKKDLPTKDQEHLAPSLRADAETADVDHGGDSTGERSGDLDPAPTDITAKGTRLPIDYMPTPQMIAWVKESAPHALPDDHRAFVNYWVAASGKSAVKRSWELTWYNWMRRASRDRGTGGGRARQQPSNMTRANTADPIHTERQRLAGG